MLKRYSKEYTFTAKEFIRFEELIHKTRGIGSEWSRNINFHDEYISYEKRNKKLEKIVKCVVYPDRIPIHRYDGSDPVGDTFDRLYKETKES